MNSPRIVVLGYSLLGYRCLKALLDGEENVVGVVTYNDDPNENIFFPSVKALGIENDIPTFTPADVNSEDFFDVLVDLKPDIIFSFAYRQLIKEHIINLPRLGCFNIHPSLLPAYRGRCPINWVLVKGEQQTGVTLHHIDKGADTGDIVEQRVLEIGDEDTAISLWERAVDLSVEILRNNLASIKLGNANRIEQHQGNASYFGGRGPQDGLIDWNLSAKDTYNLVRAVTHPYPGAFTYINNKKVFIWWAKPIEDGSDLAVGKVFLAQAGNWPAIKAGHGALLLDMIQIEGLDEASAIELFEKGLIKEGDVCGTNAY